MRHPQCSATTRHLLLFCAAVCAQVGCNEPSNGIADDGAFGGSGGSGTARTPEIASDGIGSEPTSGSDGAGGTRGSGDAGGSGGTSDEVDSASTNGSATDGSASGGTSSTGGQPASTGGGAGGTGGLGEGGGCSDCDKEGESCANPIVVNETGFMLTGEDISADFSNDLDLSQECSLTEGGSDVVLSVSLEAGQLLSVTQSGEVPTVIALQSSCGSEYCLGSARASSTIAPEKLTLEYEATESAVVLVIVDALHASPETPSYEIHVDIDPLCGNGFFEGPEDCDDGDTEDGDGCSPTCIIEFGYTCSKTPKSFCTPYPPLGEFAVDGNGAAIVHTDLFETARSLYYTFKVTESLLLDIEASSQTGNIGDINFRVWSETGELVRAGWHAGNEAEEIALEPGRYLLELFATTDLPDGFTLNVSPKAPGTCGDEIVVVPFEECDNGGKDGCVHCKVEWGWWCTYGSPSLCSSFDSIGSGTYRAGDPIDVENGDPFIGYGMLFWMIAFEEEVVLSGTLSGDEYHHFDGVRLLKQGVDGDELVAEHWESEVLEIPEWLVPAGEYKLELTTYTGLPYGYTLALSTAEP